MKTLFAFVSCTATLLAGAHHAGRFHDRSEEKSRLLAEACEQVTRFPPAFAQWESRGLPVEDEDAMRRGGAVEFVSRIYSPKDGGESISLLLACGKAGPLCAHTPELCYAGAAYTPDSNQRNWKPIEAAEFTWQTFSSKVAGQPNLEIAWAWSVDGRWRSPPSPRLVFGREAYLYKVYLVRACRSETEPSRPMKEFAEAVIPTLARSVFEATDSNSKAGTSNAPSRLTDKPPRMASGADNRD
jgi:hypothetical protein